MKWALTGVVSATAILLAAPVAAQNLRIGITEEIETLDPAQGRTISGRHAFAALCDKLVEAAPDGSFVPRLATEWALAEDQLSIRMKLRHGVKFHDGEKFDAAAVKFNLERAKNLPESRRKSEVAAIRDVEVVSDDEVKINLSAPFSPLIAQLTDRAGMMVSPKAAREKGAAIGNEPVCSGPYKFVRRIPQERVDLERFPEHWEAAKYHAERVSFLPIPDATVRLANLRAGQLDIMERVTPTDLPQIRGDKRLAVATTTSIAYAGLTFNIANTDRANAKFGKDGRLRRALELAIDRQVMNQVVYAGEYIAANQFVPPGSFYYDEKLPLPPRDVNAAKALLKEAGAEQAGFTLIAPNSPEKQQIAQMIQGMAREAGIDVKINAVETLTMVQQAQEGNFEAMLYDWSGRVDPDGSLHQFVTCKGSLNDGKYCNPELDKLLEAARVESDRTKRKALYDQAQEILARERPIIYLHHPKVIVGYSAKLDGVVAYPDGLIRVVGVKPKS